MNIYNITANNKRQDLTYSYKIFYILGFFLVLLVLSFLVLKDILAFICIFISALALFFILSKPPTSLKVQISEKSIFIDGREFVWSDIRYWTIVKYVDNQNEFLFQTNKVQEPFVGFFVVNNFENSLAIENFLNQKIPYKEGLIMDNPIEIFIRWIGLK
jgi:hypothetical protein